MHADRTNRVVLLVVAVIMVVGGGLLAALSWGAFGTARAQLNLTDNRIPGFVGRHGNWFWIVVAIIAVLVALLALRWLLAILASTDRVADLVVATDGPPGRTLVVADALTDAVADEVAGYRGVQAARARLIGHPSTPVLVVTATLEDGCPFGEVRGHIESGALVHARSAVGRPDLAIQLDLDVAPKSGARLR